MKKLFESDYKLGILGGGQLGRMLIRECVNYNIQAKVLEPDTEAPCKDVTRQFINGSILDYNDVYLFGKELDLLTIEIENVNVDALTKLSEEGLLIYPKPNTIRLIQDKGIQKEFYRNLGIPTSNFILTENRDEVVSCKFPLPAVQKMRKAGYDGHGVRKIISETDLPLAFDVPSVVESLVPIQKELSVVSSRNENGVIMMYPVVESIFSSERNLVDYSISPAAIDPLIEKGAYAITEAILDELKHVGLLVVEMFLTTSNELLVNEIAPRPHNCGHHTMNGFATSQFEQHLRAILNLNPGSVEKRSNYCGMINLLGEEGYEGVAKYEGLESALSLEGVFVHLYGKKKTRPFRKMGHLNVIESTRDDVLKKINKIKQMVRVIS